MFRSTSLFTAAVVGLLGVSGCKLFTRAVKGELTPVGVEQATMSDVSSLQTQLASQDDAATFERAFTDLASVYLYKCLENPTRVPKEGKADIRTRAGEAMVAAMHDRVARHDLGGDPVVAASGSKVAALQKQVSAKCDAAKLDKLDPGGYLARAVALVQPDGRDEYVKATASTLDGELAAALKGDERAVLDWAVRDCPKALPGWDYCVPRAVEGLYAEKRLDGIVGVFLELSDAKADEILPRLGKKVGDDALAQDLRKYLLEGAALPGAPRGLDRTAAYLDSHGVWGTCDDRSTMLSRALKSDSTLTAEWALARIVSEKCRNLDNAVVQALASNSPRVRQKAVWTVGELSIQKAKKHVQRLQWSDPWMSEDCYCYPVRDAAKNAYNKLEIAND